MSKGRESVALLASDVSSGICCHPCPTSARPRIRPLPAGLLTPPTRNPHRLSRQSELESHVAIYGKRLLRFSVQTCSSPFQLSRHWLDEAPQGIHWITLILWSIHEVKDGAL